MGRDRVTIHAINNGELAEFLHMAGLEDEVKKDAFICDGCGRTMTISDVSHIRTAKPKLKVYGAECARMMGDLDEAEIGMWKDWIKEKKEQQDGKPWPKWMFAKNGWKKNEKHNE